MCGRYMITTPLEAVARLFAPESVPRFNQPPRYNVAPTQSAPVVRNTQTGGRELVLLRWGLVPRWAKDLRTGARAINARGESVRTKPIFREAFAMRRCVVPADGYFEWRNVAGAKWPEMVTRADGALMALAAIWSRWQGADGQVVDTYAIVTTESAPALASLHDRMPLVLSHDAVSDWMESDPETAQLLIRPSTLAFTQRPVSRRLNTPRNDDPSLLHPDADEPSSQGKDTGPGQGTLL